MPSGRTAPTSSISARSSVSVQSAGTLKRTPSVSASISRTPRCSSSTSIWPSTSRPRRVTSPAASRRAGGRRSPMGEVGAQEQRRDQGLAGAGGGDPLVGLGGHLGEGEGGRQEQPRELVDLQDVVEGVAADALGVSLEGGPDLG